MIFLSLIFKSSEYHLSNELHRDESFVGSFSSMYELLCNPAVHYLIHKRPWSLSWARWIMPIPLHPNALKSIFIFSSHLCEGLPSGFPAKTLCAVLFYPVRVAWSSHSPWHDHWIIFGEEYKVWSSSSYIFFQPHIVSSLFNAVLEHTESVFFP
jgi:hypothetical protein